MIDLRPLDENLAPCRLGEGAFWDSQTASLYWVDILGRTVHHYSVGDRQHRQWTVSKEVSFAYPKKGRLVLCLADGVYDFDPSTGAEVPVALLELPEGHRLNDGKLDPQGRLWVGTINTSDEPSETAALFFLAGSSKLKLVTSTQMGKHGAPTGASCTMLTPPGLRSGNITTIYEPVSYPTSGYSQRLMAARMD